MLQFLDELHQQDQLLVYQRGGGPRDLPAPPLDLPRPRPRPPRPRPRPVNHYKLSSGTLSKTEGHQTKL